MKLDSYITTEETELSPAVIMTTVLLVAVFALGLLYQLVTAVV